MDSAGTVQWWLVRHAPTVNPERLVYGTLDLDIVLPDRDVLAAISDLLPADPVWITSPLGRTRRTLEALLAARGVVDAEIHVEPAFAEQDFGEWEGRVGADVWAEIRAEDMSWPGDIRPPGGESFTDVAARVAAAADAWAARLAGRDAVAVIHSGSIRAFLAAAMGGQIHAALAYVADPLSVTRCDHLGDDGWRVGFVNRIASAPPR